MKQKVKKTTATVIFLAFFLIGSAQAVIFMPKGDVPDFLDRLPSELSRGVNQKIVKEAQTVMIHQPPERSEKGEDLVFEAKVRNRPSHALVVIHYRHESGQPFFTRGMDTADDSIFTYKLPGYLLSDQSVEYYLEVISATQVHAQSGTYFQPHRVDLFSRTGSLKYLAWGVALVAGAFMLFRMGSTRKKAPRGQTPKSPKQSTGAEVARSKLSAKVRR